MALSLGLILAVLLVGCETDPVDDSPRPLELHFEQSLLLPDSKPTLTLLDSHRLLAQRMTLSVQGTIDGRAIDSSLDKPLHRPGQTGPLKTTIRADQALWPMLQPQPGSQFEGQLIVVVEDELGDEHRGSLSVDWRFQDRLVPDLTIDQPTQLFSNEHLPVSGEGILRPHEGVTKAVVVEGQLQPDEGDARALDGQRFPIQWDGSRRASAITLDPDIIGIRPASVDLNLRFENHHRLGSMEPQSGPDQHLQSSLASPFIAHLEGKKISRGQIIDVRGRGLLGPADADTVDMEFHLEGYFQPDDPSSLPVDWTGSQALSRAPHSVSEGRRADLEAWATVADRRLQGFAARPGTFQGTMTPVFFDDQGSFEGLPWEGQLTVLPTLQAVHLKYLPGFSIALERFGLRNADRAIRDRILEVVQRDYEGINIRFSESAPDDFIRFSTVEIGGPDPTGGHAFGFDNTYHDEAKDTGNLYLDNYLGGINPQSGEAFNNPYGGVFVESFAKFSPTIAPHMAHTSPRFDDVFGPFMPELAGDPVGYDEPLEATRHHALQKAIDAFANAVGNTISHELGHALGLAHFEEDWEEPGYRFHNHGQEGHIMDAGEFRSFEQRANLDGEGPSQFNATNRAYLETILPLP